MRVKMSEELKQHFNDNGCEEHVKEFGNCVGVVDGFTDYGQTLKGPEVDVRWQPSNRRYAYDPKTLIIVDREKKLKRILKYE